MKILYVYTAYAYNSQTIKTNECKFGIITLHKGSRWVFKTGVVIYLKILVTIGELQGFAFYPDTEV